MKVITDKLNIALILLTSLGLVACGGNSSDRLPEDEIVEEEAVSSDDEESSNGDDQGNSDDSSDSGDSEDVDDSGEGSDPGDNSDEGNGSDSGGNGNPGDGGDPGENSEPGDGGGEDSGDDESTDEQSTLFDITEYLFDQDLDFLNNSVSYPVTIYSIDTGENQLPGIEFGEAFDKISDNVIIQSDLEGELLYTYEIQQDQVLETVHEAMADRSFDRLVEIGDTYLNADNENLLLNTTERATCQLIDHLDFFDMSSATGEFNLSEAVYEDVLHVYCETGFVTGAQFEPHTLLHHYFAKDIGSVFTSGTMIFFGDVYYIPERTEP